MLQQGFWRCSDRRVVEICWHDASSLEIMKRSKKVIFTFPEEGGLTFFGPLFSDNTRKIIEPGDLIRQPSLFVGQKQVFVVEREV